MSSSIDLPPPVESYFMMFMRTQFVKDVPPPEDLDLAGQTGIITGATSGIGMESAHVFLQHGLSRLFITTRDPDRGQEVATALSKAHPGATIYAWPLDMQSYDSIRAFVEQCRASLDLIDFTILNAGVMKTNFSTNATTGHEEMIQVNYLSTVLLASLLRPVLREKRRNDRPNRLTLVGSSIAQAARFAEKDKSPPLLPALSDPAGWGMRLAMDRYATSKLLLMLFLAKFANTTVDPAELTVNLVCPGNVRDTGLGGLPGLARPMTRLYKRLTGRSLRAAAWTEVDAAVVKGPESHGCFIVDWKISPFVQLLYTPEGKWISDRLWEETLQEFRNAGIHDIHGA